MSGSAQPTPWNWLRQEPELAALYQWLDSERPSPRGREWGIWGGITGTAFGLAAAFTAFILNTGPTRYELLVFPFAIAGVISLVAAAAILRQQLPAQKMVQNAFRDAYPLMWQLVSARWKGNVTGLLGQDRAHALNEGAEYALRCREAIRSAAWQAVAPDSDFVRAREATGQAMEIAMARLMTTIGQGASGSNPEIGALLKDMHATADEAVRTSERLASQTGQPAHASDALRRAVSEMRVLNDAHDEVDRLRH